jgi:signal transduction histidine kinase
VTEIPTAIGNGAVLDSLLQRWGVSSALAAPICRGHDVAGVLVASWGNRTGAFGARAHRMILGVAHTVAVTLENARLIDDLQAANKLKTEFVSTMSHELRTPLNVILGYADMARDDRMPDDDWRTCLDRIDAAGRELLELIEDTLEIGRIEAGRDEVRLETVALPTFWSGLGDTCRRMPRRDGVSLVWATAPAHGVLVTDPRKLTVVVRNLVGNALKFTEAGLVRCDVTTRGEEVTLRIADTGIGIPPEQQGAIFDMFRQVDGSDRRRYGGAGLGLYITRRFVEQLGGQITLESAPGTGSTFVVTLPTRQSQPPARRAA